MIKVKLTTCDGNQPIENTTLKQTPGLSGKWGDFQFSLNNEMSDCDYWVVFECFPKIDSTFCPKENTIYIAGESSFVKNYNEKFLNQFSKIITCQRNIHHPHTYHMAPGHIWIPQKSYDELYEHDNVEKNKLISIVVSNKSNTPGHKKRLEFCLNLKKRFGDKIDIFGRGINEFDDKWDVLAPYKYSIAIENCVETDWMTEKIGDCFTSLTFPFYYGCPNIDRYYDKNSYQLIDIDDFEGSCNIIEKIINDEHHYKRHLKSLIESKNKYLNEHSLIPLIATFIQNEYGTVDNSTAEKITIKPVSEFQKNLATSIKRSVKKLLNKNIILKK